MQRIITSSSPVTLLTVSRLSCRAVSVEKTRSIRYQIEPRTRGRDEIEPAIARPTHREVVTSEVVLVLGSMTITAVLASSLAPPLSLGRST